MALDPAALEQIAAYAKALQLSDQGDRDLAHQRQLEADALNRADMLGNQQVAGNLLSNLMLGQNELAINTAARQVNPRKAYEDLQSAVTSTGNNSEGILASLMGMYQPTKAPVRTDSTVQTGLIGQLLQSAIAQMSGAKVEPQRTAIADAMGLVHKEIKDANRWAIESDPTPRATADINLLASFLPEYTGQELFNLYKSGFNPASGLFGSDFNYDALNELPKYQSPELAKALGKQGNEVGLGDILRAYHEQNKAAMPFLRTRLAAAQGSNGNVPQTIPIGLIEAVLGRQSQQQQQGW